MKLSWLKVLEELVNKVSPFLILCCENHTIMFYFEELLKPIEKIFEKVIDE